MIVDTSFKIVTVEMHEEDIKNLRDELFLWKQQVQLRIKEMETDGFDTGSIEEYAIQNSYNRLRLLNKLIGELK